MVHLKREQAPKSWRTSRKGTSFIAMPRSTKGAPLVVILRDILEVVQNKREVKKAIYERKVLVNGKAVKDEKKGLGLFDTISFVPSGSHYRVSLSEKGKYKLEEIEEKESKSKIAKISNKKKLKHGKIQINLNDGRNFFFDKEVSTDDSVIVDLEQKKISKHIPLKKNSNVVAFSGKHKGKEGKVEEIDNETKKAKISNDQEKLNVPLGKIIAIE